MLISLTREYYMNLEAQKAAAAPVATGDQPGSKPVAPSENATSSGVAPAGETAPVGPLAPVTGQPVAIASAAAKSPIADAAAKAGERGNGLAQAGPAVPYAATLALLDFDRPSISRQRRGVRRSDAS